MTQRAIPLGLVCARCARRVSWSGRRGRYIHAGGGPVAACDLDAEHAAEPDWTRLGETSCIVCDAPLAGSTTGFSHRDPVRDDDHAADPGFPLGPGASRRET